MPDYFSDPLPEPKKPDYFGNQGVDWKKHEADVAKRAKGKRSRSSGAGHGKTGQSRPRASVSPGDVEGIKTLRECKATAGRSITIKGDWLDQLVQQGLRMRRDPVLELRIEGLAWPTPTDWVMLPAADFERLMRGEDGD